MVTTRETKEIILTAYFEDVRDLTMQFIKEHGEPYLIAGKNELINLIMTNLASRYQKMYHLVFYFKIEENPEDITNPVYWITHILDETTGILQTAKEWVTKGNLPDVIPSIVQ